ncbi:MAG: diheme cytochrome c-553 [Candidatus Binatia bacterium]
MKSKRLLWLAFSALGLAGACAFNSPGEKIPADWEQASYIERGNYLVNYLGHCTGCHTPLGANRQSDMSLFLSGVPAKFAGAKAGPPQIAGFPGPRGARVYAKNLTPDPETGLGRWTEEQFVQTFKHGVRPDGVKYAISPMEWNIYANMKEEDVRAMYRYLRTVKPISNKAPANIPPK